MSQNNPPIVYVGLDVAKLSLELHLAGKTHSLTNDTKGYTKLLKHLRTQPGAQVLCEATGGYEQAAVHVLHAAGLPVSVIEAGRVRSFAKAQGLRAKTDPIDAAVLTAYGIAFRPPATPPGPPQQRQLADLAQRRRQLIQTGVSERNRAAIGFLRRIAGRSTQGVRLLRLDEGDRIAAAAAILEEEPAAEPEKK